MSYEQKYLEDEAAVEVVGVSKKTNSFSTYIQNNETVDTQVDNLMEFIFGDVIFREVE
tara:strand:- start:1896 stop:2069 length:174 start_codon:yes stop_codon:yes gene_type:complete